jgi:hypothetical protein
MPVTVKSIVIWRKEIDNEVGVLARTLEPLHKAGADLQVLNGLPLSGQRGKSCNGAIPCQRQEADSGCN